MAWSRATICLNEWSCPSLYENCIKYITKRGISYFIFDDIASLAGSADAQNVDPDILKEICKGLKDENPYCG